MTLGDAIRKAVDGRDIILMDRAVDFLRLRYRMTSEGIRKYFEEVIGREISLSEWDCWMQQCDGVAGQYAR